MFVERYIYCLWIYLMRGFSEMCGGQYGWNMVIWKRLYEA
jgi:hypothetical protein